MRFLLPLFAALAAGCNPVAELDEAEAGVETVHARYDAGEPGFIWDTSAPAMKQANTRDELSAFFVSMREQLGPVRDTERTGFNINTNNGVTTTVLTQNTKFERGSGVETFTFESTDGGTALVAYHIDSDDFSVQPGEATGSPRSPGPRRQDRPPA